MALSRPHGKGWYLRGDMTPREGISQTHIGVLKYMGIRFVGVNIVHPITIRRLDSAGIYAWCFGGPGTESTEGQWDPKNWRATLAASMRIGNGRIIADPETRWPRAPASEWQALGAALAAACKSGFQVIATTHGGLWTRFAKYIAPQIAPFGGMISPQLYDHMATAPLNYAESMLPKWRDSMSGCEIIPSIGAFAAGPGAGEYSAERFAAVFREYDKMPVRAAMVWPVPGGRARNNAEYAVIRKWRVGSAVEV